VTKPNVVIFENETFRIEKRFSGGRRKPAGLTIVSKADYVGKNAIYNHEKLAVDYDDLFTLAEILDDICDELEDRYAEEAKKVSQALEDSI